MSLSTLNPPLPALEDLITPTPQPATPTKKGIGLRLSRDIRRDILLLRDLNNDDEIEYISELPAYSHAVMEGKLRYAQYNIL
jgi:hypothetical protein